MRSPSGRGGEKELLEQARAMASPAELAAFLKGACAGNPGLRARIEAALRAPVPPSIAPANPHGEEPETIVGEAPILEQPGQMVGRFKLLEKLGEGGFGAVYVAEQREPVKRRVALKLIKLGMDTRQVVARFEAERQALALMDHPNIAKVLDAGSTDTGRPYFVMELVRGVPITRYCDENNLPTAERLELFIKVCHAIQHAHQKGIIHRDIKPSNILVTMHDGVPVPKVIDFGIAKATQGELTDRTVYTQFQQFIGTPAYISPEQAEMSGLDIDTRSDIYSLGVLLYELLVGNTPFDGRDLLASGLDEMRRIIREKEPARPSTRVSSLKDQDRTTTALRRGTDPARLISLLKGDLDWIVMKCLEKDRTRRYETANGVAMDIRRFLNQEPVLARPPSSAYRLQKAFRRNKLAFVAAAGIAVALLAGAGLSTWQFLQKSKAYQRALAAEADQRRLRQEAESARANEATLRLRAQRDAYAAEINIAQHALRDGNIFRARQLLAGHQPAPGAEDFRSFDWRYLWQQCHSDELATIAGHTSAAQCVAVSPDGRLLASGDLYAGLLRVWDVATRREAISALPFGAGAVMRFAAFSPDGHVLAASAMPGTVRLWNTRTWEEVATLQAPDKAERLAFSPDGRWLAAGVQSEEVVKLWDLKTRQSRGSFPGIKHDRPCVAFSPDSRLLAYGLGDNRVRLVDVATLHEVATLSGHRDLVVHVEFSPDGQTLATASSDTTVKFWDVRRQVEIGSLAGHKRRVTSVTFSPDGQTLATSCIDGTIKLWDFASRTEKATLIGHSEWVNNVAFLPDGRTLVSCSDDKTLKLWDTRPRSREFMVGSFTNVPYWTISFGHKHVLTLHTDQGLTLWDAAMGTPKVTIPFPMRISDLASADVSDMGHVAALVGTNGTVRILDLAARKEREPFSVPPGRGQNVALSADEKSLIVVSGNGRYDLNPDGRSVTIQTDLQKVSVFDLGTRKPISEFSTTNILYPAAIPAGGFYLVQGEEKARHLLDPANGRRMASFRVDSVLMPWSTDFTVDRKLAACRDVDQTVWVWDTGSGRIVASFAGHAGIINSAVFSPDGTMLATGDDRSTIKIWDIVHKRELHTLRATSGWINNIDFSPDRKTLATVTHDGVLTLWSIVSGRELMTVSDRVAPNSYVAFTAGTSALVCGGEDSRFYAYRAPSWEEIRASDRTGPGAKAP